MLTWLSKTIVHLNSISLLMALINYMSKYGEKKISFQAASKTDRRVSRISEIIQQLIPSPSVGNKKTQILFFLNCDIDAGKISNNITNPFSGSIITTWLLWHHITTVLTLIYPIPPKIWIASSVTNQAASCSTTPDSLSIENVIYT